MIDIIIHKLLFENNSKKSEIFSNQIGPIVHVFASTLFGTIQVHFVLFLGRESWMLSSRIIECNGWESTLWTAYCCRCIFSTVLKGKKNESSSFEVHLKSISSCATILSYIIGFRENTFRYQIFASDIIIWSSATFFCNRDKTTTTTNLHLILQLNSNHFHFIFKPGFPHG